MALEARTVIRKVYLDKEIPPSIVIGRICKKMPGLLKIAYAIIALFTALIVLACIEFVAFFFVGPDTGVQFVIAWQLVVSTFLLFAGVALYIGIEMGGLKP